MRNVMTDVRLRVVVQKRDETVVIQVDVCVGKTLPM
jgi:hypothetical protein